MSFNSDDLDAFLWEVETVTKQVHDIIDGKVDINKIIEKEKAKKEKKDKEESLWKQKEEMKLQEELDKKRKGNPGKGEKDTYVKFCKRCFVEYEIDCTSCYHCNGNTISREVNKHINIGKEKRIARESRKPERKEG